MFADSTDQIPAIQAPNCPRCASANTKFCYYNNYSLTQPRYFCKGCRRYWTKGGSLRNVPVGGGCRKTRRSRSRANASHRNDTGYPLHSNDTTDSSSSSGKSNGAEIDMAAVFARYVSQDSAGPTQSVSESAGEHLDTAFNQELQDQQVDDLESFDYEMLLADDVFWSASEDGSSLSSNVANWEPMAALEELDSSLLEYMPVMDDQFANASTNWSCFDLSAYGDFYRP